MLTLPEIIERPAQPYVAIRRLVTIPFGGAIAETVPKLFHWVKSRGVEQAGPLFFKYNVIDMERELEIDFGVPTRTLVTGDDDVVVGTLPAGRYASLTYHGSYDDLIEVTATLLGWVQIHRYRLDMAPTDRGDTFASRLEIYTNGPDEVSSPEELETILAFKLADG